MYSIYYLSSSEFPCVPRYVGFTSRGVEKRRVEHVRERGNSVKSKWVQKVYGRGFEIISTEIFSTDDSDMALLIESEKICRMKLDGFPLCNGTSGGDRGYTHSERSVDIIRKKALGRKRSPESIEMGASKLRGRKLSEERIEQIRAASTGRRHYEETIIKLKRPKSESHKDKLRGLVRSDETKEKVRIAAAMRPPLRGAKYKGVQSSCKKHYAKIMINGKVVVISSHETAEDAARAYDRKAIEVYNGLCYLNFPQDKER